MSKIRADRSLKLLSGALMPQVGFGTWKIPSETAQSAVKNALATGYQLIDCAAIYKNEKEIGKALKTVLKDEKSLKREDIFLTSKLFNSDHARQDVAPALKRTLNDLKVDYLDLYLMHFPISWPNDRPSNDVDGYPESFKEEWRGVQTGTSIFETWTAMEECVRMGLVKSIGVSNFSSGLIWELDKHASMPICVNQIECHPFLSQRLLKNMCRDKGIQITAYSSLGSVSYENRGIYGKLPNLLDRMELKEIGQRHGKSVAQILLAWAVHTHGVAVIPKSTHLDRVRENLDIFEIELTEEDVHAIEEFDQGLRFNDPGLNWGIPIF